MPDKGKVMSQTFYERQSKLIGLYRESVLKKELKVDEAVMSLKLIGFSDAMALSKAREWAALPDSNEPETERAKKIRQKQRVSLEKYALNMILDKKYYNENEKKYLNEHRMLKSKYKKGSLSKDNCVIQLIQSGYSREFAEVIVEKWGDGN